MGDEVSRLIEQRAVMRAAIACLAEPLHGAAKDEFVARAEARFNRELPAPGRQHMKMYLRAVPNE